MADLPVLTGPGTRVRAGNAMGRTRTALMEAALSAIETRGARKATMGDVSRIANVAKGTLYNHFRSKEELYAAAARAAVLDLAERASEVAASDGLGAGLAAAADALATSSVLARLRADEPAVLGQLIAVAVTAETREAVSAVLVAGGAGADGIATDVVLRWLIGFTAGAADPASLRGEADRVAEALLATRRTVVELPSPTAEVAATESVTA